jgi:glutathione S-transferase
MRRTLVVGNLNYSSWSLRPWLALKHAGIDFQTHAIELFVDPAWRDKVLRFSGAAKVPILVDGPLSVHESLAICEYAAELAPESKLWAGDRAMRARGRASGAEMGRGYTNLRNEMSFNARARPTNFRVSPECRAEIERATDIWSASLQSSGGPYLFGHFTIADCMYFPILGRLRTYGVKLDGDALRYDQVMWDNPLVKEWYALARAAPAIPKYDKQLSAC